MTSIKTFQIISEYGKYKHLKRIPVYPPTRETRFQHKEKKEQQRSLTTVAKLSPSSSSAGLAYFSNLPDKQWLTPH